MAVLILLADSGLPIAFQTAAASIVSAAWRMFIMPIDTVKTTLQVKRDKKSVSILSCRQRARARCTCFTEKLLSKGEACSGTEPGLLPLPLLSATFPGFSPSTPSSLSSGQKPDLGKMP